MHKKVFIISASLRKGSNSDMLAKEFEKGALEAGNEVETVSLREKSIGFCRGCLACLKLGKCVIGDDAAEIAEKMKSADVLVFATPVYYYSVSGQLKTMLDRANSLYGSDYKFTEVYLLATAAEDEQSTVEGTKKAVQGWAHPQSPKGRRADSRLRGRQGLLSGVGQGSGRTAPRRCGEHSCGRQALARRRAEQLVQPSCGRSPR